MKLIPCLHAEAARRKLAHYYEVFKSPAVWKFSPAWLSIFSIVGVWTNHSVGLFTGKGRFQGQLLVGSISTVKFGNGFATLATFFVDRSDPSRLVAVGRSTLPAALPTFEALIEHAESSRGELLALSHEVDAAGFAERSAVRRRIPNQK